MPIHRRVLLHSEGPTLWPANRDEVAVLSIRATTPARVWWGTLQGLPTAPGGTIFLERWWADIDRRYEVQDRAWVNRCIARYISIDAAESESENAAYTAAVVGELMPDYRLLIRHAWRDRLLFPDQVEAITALARRFNQDEKLRAVVIEDASNGTALLQSFAATGAHWLRRLIAGYRPGVSKEERANQASVYCKNGMVLLPLPDEKAPWLMDFEDDLFNFPGAAYKDWPDAFSQLILYLEHYLSRGLLKRQGRK